MIPGAFAVDSKAFDEKVAVRDGTGPLTYAQLGRVVDALARRLDGLGLTPGDRVAGLLPNSLELLAAYYASIGLGLVFVPINARLSAAEVAGVLDHCRPGVLLTGPGTPAHLVAGAGASVQVVELAPARTWDHPTASEPLPRRDWPPDHPAVLFYTSGSTGRPKGVLYTHRTLAGVREVHTGAFDIGPHDTSVLCHCMTANFVFAQLTIPFLAAGGTVEIVPFGDVPATLDAVDRGATFLSLIPWLGFRLIGEARARGRRPNRLRVVEVGGDRVPREFFDGFEDAFGILPREHIGMSEANSYAVNPEPGDGYRMGSVGLPMPGVAIEIRDGDGIALGPDREGQIWVRTPAGMAGYWNDPDTTGATMDDGWIATGDLGRLDADGYLWLTGRIKQIVIVDGDNVHPGEVERAVSEHPSVARVCAVGIPHETRGAEIGVAVVPAAPGLTLEALTQFLEPRLSDVKIPRHLLLVDAIPETRAGKLDRRWVAERIVADGSGI